MDADLMDEKVLWPTPWCVVREQGEQYLIYNRKSDELHLLPQTGYFVFQLCDGFNTVSDIEKQLVSMMEVDEIELRSVLHNYLIKLIERGILDMDRHE